MRRGLRRAVVAAFLMLATAVLADPLVLDVRGLRQLAFTAVKAGYANDALAYTDALLERDAGDSTALAIRSQALRALGRLAEAKGAAKDAWTSADNDAGRYGAAMAMAQALSSGGRRGAAQWWLRRAGQNAPNARAETVARRDFAYVKSRNPWDIQINASAAPSSNVNNGSQQDRLTLAGLPFVFEIPEGSQALSGFESGLGIRGTYRFSPTAAGRQTRATISLLGQMVSLSSEAKSRAPEARGSDYAYAAVEGGLHHVFSVGQAKVSGGGTLGRNWYGGAPLSDYIQLEAAIERPINAREALSVGVSLDKVMRIDSPVQSSDRVELRLDHAQRLASGDRMTLGFSAGRTMSDSAEVENHAMGLSLGWAKAAPLHGLGLSAGLKVESKVFERSRYAAGGREDLRATVNVTVSFEEIDYLGFSPVLDLRATRNRSNAALYDSRDLGMTLGIRSSF